MELIFSVFRARWLQIAVIALSITAAGALATYMMPKKYQAQASFVIDTRPNEVAGMTASQGMLPASYLATQVDIVKSSRVAEKVFDALDGAVKASLEERFNKSRATGAFRDWAVREIQSGLVVAPSRESNVINVTYHSSKPEMASVLANAFVNGYVQTAIELRAQPAQRYSEFFESEAKVARERLKSAQDRLEQYRRQHGISVNDERLDSENTRLGDLNRELVLLQSRAAETADRAQQARRSPDRIADIMNDPVLVEMRNNLQRARTTLSEQQQQLGSSHPKILEAQAAVRDLTARIREETARLAETVSASNSTNEQRIVAIKKAIDEQRRVVADLQTSRGEAGLLRQDVENAQNAYNAIIKGENQTRLESRSTQGSASVLEVATPPGSPSSPKPIINLFASAFGGMLLGLIYALVKEARNGVVRSEHQLLEMIGQPVIASVPRFKHSDRLQVDPRRSIGRAPNPLLLR